MQIDIHADRTMRTAVRRRPARRPWLPLLSALMDMSRGQAELISHNERNWASVTFTGTRHTIVLAFTGAEAIGAGEDFTATLPDHEFAIPRQIVADASIVRVDHTMLPEPRMEVEAELLLIEDC
jgi:hypothetical protein